MNIVFVTDNFVSPTAGGIVRITHVLAQAFVKQYGHSCYSVYAHTPSKIQQDGTPFIWHYQWKSKDDFLSKIATLGSCTIIIQAPCSLAKQIIPLELSPSVKLIYVFHGTPGFDLVPLRWQVALYHLTHIVDFTKTLKQLLIQLATALTSQKFMQRLIQAKYALPLGKVNHMVVMSQGTINQYLSIAPNYATPFSVIPNAFVFDQCTLTPKKKEVLIVARLEDWHKRILDAIQIWQKIQLDQSFSSWTLRIVGEGFDLPFYREYVQKRHIPNISFEGHQSPLRYYQDASIFMMTSACEGMPMTLLEAKQCGCVPIVYNNFASAQDLIQHQVSGLLVDTDDVQGFVASLKQLMTNENMREEMRLQCMQHNHQFDIETVAAQWHKLICKESC